MLVKVVLPSFLDILEKDSYESVSVFAALLMPKTDSMPYFMNRTAFVAPWSQRNELLSPPHAN
jgi:hypothetical protein